MKTEDVARQIMQNDLDRAMKDWLCTSKEDLKDEAGARSWDETIDNVWLRMSMCDHLLEPRSSKLGDRMTQNLYEAFHMHQSQDTYVSSGNVWRNSWENQYRMQTLLGQIYRGDNGSYYGKVKWCGKDMRHAYGKRVTDQ